MPVSAPRRQDGVAARALPAVGSVLTPKPAWSPSLGSDTVPGQRGVAPAEPMAGRCLLWEMPWRGVCLVGAASADVPENGDRQKCSQQLWNRSLCRSPSLG